MLRDFEEDAWAWFLEEWWWREGLCCGGDGLWGFLVWVRVVERM